ncbi:hypothetical protein ACX0KM_04540 [Pseudomonas promysalinigenes]|uniref:hypothetical protein n=1 Tax=Pseudomonas juntendi TaxID=2666183 RepID=UPI001F3448C1|nr:hypothetical protein [Pseudomonas juntendi]
MSKLSKFKSRISVDEAATLLSRLIGEEVSSEELEMIYTCGWLTASHNCHATIVKLTPALDPEQHAIQAAWGRYHMIEGEDFGICFSVNLPLDQVDIVGRGRVYTLRDEEGNFYALRDIQSNQYLGDMNDDFMYFEDGGIAPSDIYELAEKANNDKPAPKENLKIMENTDCLCSVKLYNFPPNESEHRVSRMPVDSKPVTEPPSLVLAVAALVEIVTDEKGKRHNQASLIDEILDRFDLRGLSKSNLEKMFSQANRKLTEARAAKA